MPVTTTSAVFANSASAKRSLNPFGSATGMLPSCTDSRDAQPAKGLYTVYNNSVNKLTKLWRPRAPSSESHLSISLCLGD